MFPARLRRRASVLVRGSRFGGRCGIGRGVVRTSRKPFPQRLRGRGLRRRGRLRRLRLFPGRLFGGFRGLRDAGRKKRFQLLGGHAFLRIVQLSEIPQQVLGPLFAQKRFQKLYGDVATPGGGERLRQWIQQTKPLGRRTFRRQPPICRARERFERIPLHRFVPLLVQPGFKLVAPGNPRRVQSHAVAHRIRRRRVPKRIEHRVHEGRRRLNHQIQRLAARILQKIGPHGGGKTLMAGRQIEKLRARLAHFCGLRIDPGFLEMAFGERVPEFHMQHLFEIIGQRPGHGFAADIRTSVIAVRRKCSDQAIKKGLGNRSNHGVSVATKKITTRQAAAQGVEGQKKGRALCPGALVQRVRASAGDRRRRGPGYV